MLIAGLVIIGLVYFIGKYRMSFHQEVTLVFIAILVTLVGFWFATNMMPNDQASHQHPYGLLHSDTTIT
jgi:hypothetical protein